MLTLSAALEDCTRGSQAARNNNFNLLRLGAAILVVLGHSILLTGDLDNSFAWRIGYAAVNCFFVISGFLVCASLLARNGSLSFVSARLLRIYPALIVVVTVTAFVMGPVLTTLSPSTYFSDQQTWGHWIRNTLLVVGDISLVLPGVFTDNPLPNQVNAPLWTLQYELVLYATLFALYWLCQLIERRFLTHLFRWLVLGLSVVAMVGFLLNVASNSPRTDSTAQLFRFAAMFGMGASLYLFRTRVQLRVSWCLIIVGVIAAASLSRPAFVTLAWLSLPYLLLCMAYLPRGPLLLFNRAGDCSYGTYIIAFPVQQALVLRFDGISPIMLFVSTLCITLPLAAASWHWVERPMLGFKRRRSNH